MDRYQLLLELAEIEKETNAQAIVNVEQAIAEGNEILARLLYDPRNCAVVIPRPPMPRRRPGAIRYGKYPRKRQKKMHDV